MIQELPLRHVRPNADQARKIFDPAELEELAASIRRNGLVQPIKVRPLAADDYEIVMGERRWRAHNLLSDRGQWPEGTIRADIEEMDDRRRDIEMTIENLQRVEITPMEEARNYKRFLDQGMTEEELARELGIQQSWRIRDRVRLLNLAPEHIKLLEGGGLSAEAAYEISRLERHGDQARVIRMISRGQITGYKAIRTAVATILEGLTQVDIFGPSKTATEEEVATVSAMEAKVDSIARMVARGWQDGACIVARKVSPDRARLMADQLGAIRKHCLTMENQLREAAAQGALALEETIN